MSFIVLFGHCDEISAHKKTIHGVCLRDILENIVTGDVYENSTSCNFMVQIFVYTKVHVKWGLAKWVIITLQPRPFEN